MKYSDTAVQLEEKQGVPGLPDMHPVVIGHEPHYFHEIGGAENGVARFSLPHFWVKLF